MKITTLLKTFALSSCIGIALSSCTSSIRVQVLKPADINVPDSINRFAVANRSLPAEGQQLGNIVEGLFSGEGIGSDKRASGEAVVGVTNGLQESPRFEVTQVPEQLYGTGTDQMPAPLEWNEVERLCSLSNADALIVLEIFDTDSKKRYDTKPKTRTVDGQSVEYLEHTANLDMTATTGWRIYYPNDKLIVDNHTFDDGKTFTGRDDNLAGAKAKLPSKERAAKEAAYVAGQAYALRISPMFVWVSRDYFTKGSADMKMATMRAKSNDWSGAAEIWKKLAEASADPKVRKRATYNMALAAEMEGNLDLAIVWAKKARDFGMKKAINRINILEQRKLDEQRAADQMGG